MTRNNDIDGHSQAKKCWMLKLFWSLDQINVEKAAEMLQQGSSADEVFRVVAETADMSIASNGGHEENSSLIESLCQDDGLVEVGNFGCSFFLISPNVYVFMLFSEMRVVNPEKKENWDGLGIYWAY